MPKQLVFDEDARRALKNGVDALADAVKAGVQQYDTLKQKSDDALKFKLMD